MRPLKSIEKKAHQTMNVAEGVMLRLEKSAHAALAELLDGITFELEIGGKTMPVKLRMIARETDLPKG